MCATLHPEKSLVVMKGNRRFTMLVGILSCALCAVSCGERTESAVKTEYSIMKVSTADKVLTSSYSASIRGRQDINIYPQVSGTIQELCVSEGETVRAGQTLFVIDQVPYKAALNTAEANVKAAEAALASAELKYESNRQLYERKVVSDYTLKTAENEYLTAQAQLAQMQAQQVNAANNLSYTVVKSPCDGVVGTLPYRVGALVSSAMAAPLTTVSDNSSMYVYFSMTENQLLSLIRQYGSVDEALAEMPEISLRLNDGSTYGETGRIESISGVIDTQTGTVSVRAVFPNKSRLLFSGSSGNVLIPSVYEGCIVIPQEATVRYQDKVLVYKVVDGKAVSTLVTVADVDDGREYIVEDGLSVGDEIVAKGAGLLRDGMQVK